MSDSDDDNLLNCGACECAETATERKHCCYEGLCETHYYELVHECEECGREVCEICIEYGNMSGILCDKCGKFWCYYCKCDCNCQSS